MPGMGMNMQPVVPPTPIGLKHKSNLYIVMFVHIALSVFLMFLSPMTGLFELIKPLILWCAAA